MADVYFTDTSALSKRYVTETGTAWMQAVRVPVARRVNRLKRRAVERQHAARALILRVRRRVGRDDEIVRVMPAEEKQADQRFVVVDISLGDRGVHEPQVAERASEGGGAHGGAGGLADEFAAGLE